MMTIKTQKTIGLIVGLTFTALVLFLIIYGLVAPSKTPVETEWESAPVLRVCSDAPEWAQSGSEALDTAVAYWIDHGWRFKAVEKGPCNDLCKGYDEAGKEFEIPCAEGTVTLTVLPGSVWTEEHLGVCVTSAASGTITWGAVGVPPYLDTAIDWDTGEAEFLPKDAEALVLAHEFGHCLAGLGHNIGPAVIPGCATIDAKPGHIMNPNTVKTGWGDEGLAEPPEGWR